MALFVTARELEAFEHFVDVPPSIMEPKRLTILNMVGDSICKSIRAESRGQTVTYEPKLLPGESKFAGQINFRSSNEEARYLRVAVALSTSDLVDFHERHSES